MINADDLENWTKGQWGLESTGGDWVSFHRNHGGDTADGDVTYLRWGSMRQAAKWPTCSTESMNIRVGRVTHPNAWSQAPEWATSHSIGNVTVEAESPTEVRVRSRFIMTELRRDSLRTFAGSYRHWLVPEGKTFRIKLQRVDMVNARAPYDYVLQVWV